MLYQPQRDERPDIRMIENDTEHLIEILLGGLSRRDRLAQHRLHVRVMKALDRNHRAAEICRIVRRRRRAWFRRIGPSGEHPRHLLNLRLIVSRNRLPATIELRRAIRIQHDRADREQLQEFASVVFIRQRTLRRIRLVVVHHVEVKAHRRRQRDRFHHVFVVRKRILREQVQIWHHPLNADLQARNNKHLLERECDPLSQLVLPVHRVEHELRLRIVIEHAKRRGRYYRRRNALLIAKPLRKADLLNREYVRRGRSP